MKNTITALFFLLLSISASAQETNKIQNFDQNINQNEIQNIDQFGFGPALFVIEYDDEVLQDSKDVKIRGDGTISSSGSDYSTAIGLEIHYSFAFLRKCRDKGLKIEKNCTKKGKEKDDEVVEGAITSGHSLSPFLGLYDFDNGINGIAAGLVYGYWHGDNKYQDRTSLNVGIGWTVHKDRLVLANGVNEGNSPPAGLNAEDYTKRKDVTGITLMISASIGF